MKAKGDVDDRAIHEKARRRAKVAETTGLDVLPDTLQVHLVVHFCRESSLVELDLLGVSKEVLAVEVRLVRKQLVVHGPEAALRSRAFGGLGRLNGMGMNPFLREVAVSE